MQFPSSVHDLRREHYAIAGIPTYDHDDWTAYLQIPPKGALCATIGRINAGEVEFFVGDGVHPYTALGKFGTSMDAVSSALALKADAADVSAELDAISARELAYSAGIDQMFNRYNPTGLARGSLVSKQIEPTVPVDAIQGGATVIYGGMTLKNWITDGNFADESELWTGSDGAVTFAGGICSVTGDGVSGEVGLSQETGLSYVSGMTVYVKAKFRVTNAACSSIDVALSGGNEVTTQMQASPTENEWYTISKVVTITNGTPDDPVLITLAASYADGTAAEGKVMEVDQMILIHLDAYGLQASLVTAIDALLTGYLDGEANVIAQRIKSTDSAGNNPTYLYLEPITLRRNADGVKDTIANDTHIQRLDEDGVALATPVSTPGVASGILVLYPGGKVKLEPALKDTAHYTDKFEISRTGFPISSIESIRVLDPASGRYTVISTAGAVIAANGLTFTHPDLTEGDIVEAVYLWSYAGVLGENTYGYLKDPLIAYDTTGGKYYKIFPTVSAGTLEWDKTEIVIA